MSFFQVAFMPHLIPNITDEETKTQKVRLVLKGYITKISCLKPQESYAVLNNIN